MITQTLSLLVLSLFSMNANAELDSCMLAPTYGASQGLCAETSLQRSQTLNFDCQRIKNFAQDTCAAASISRYGSVASECFTLDQGSLCASVSLDRNGRVHHDCIKVKNRAQDRCASASMLARGSIDSGCFNLP